MKKILISAILFPPFSGGGTQRIKNFVENISKNPDYRLYILTMKVEYLPQVYSNVETDGEFYKNLVITRTDVCLGGQFKKGVEAGFHPTKKDTSLSFKIKRFIKGFLLPDEMIFWLPYAVKAGLRIIKNEKIDLIFSTSPPFTSHFVSYILAKLTGKKLILDYRDLYIGNPSFSRAKFVDKIAFLFEKLWLKKADAIITTTIGQKEKLQKLYKTPDSKFTLIRNGYNGSLFENLPLLYPYLENKESVNFVYSGSLSDMRTPEYLFKAIQNLISKNVIKNPKIYFVGYFAPIHKELIQKYAMEKMVEILPAMSNRDLIQFLAEKADIFLVIQRTHEGGDTAIPGKLFEYLALRKPILSMDEDNGETTKFLNSLGVKSVEFDDIDAVEQRIKEIYSEYNENIYKGDLSKFDRRNQASDLIKLFEKF